MYMTGKRNSNYLRGRDRMTQQYVIEFFSGLRQAGGFH